MPAPIADVDAVAARLEAAVQDLASLGPRLLEGAPWPLADRFDHSDEASWGPPEILAHLSEMLPFWQGEAERILDGAARGIQPAAFGRIASDDLRAGMIGRDRSLPVRELLARIAADAARLTRRIRELDDRDLATRGEHPTRGQQTVADVLDRYVVAHFEEHVVQLRSVLPG